jgi:hypothetical protein
VETRHDRVTAQYRFPADYSNIIGQLGYCALEPTRQCITILLDPGRFLNRLVADLILILSRTIMAVASIDRGKWRRR